MEQDFNWQYVIRETPLSFKFFKETMFPNMPIINKTTLSHFQVRNLYYFFDSIGILLSVESLSETQWIGHIQLRSGFSFSIKGSYKSRIDIEKASFIECFNQLEKRLTNLKNKK